MGRLPTYHGWEYRIVSEFGEVSVIIIPPDREQQDYPVPPGIDARAFVENKIDELIKQRNQ